VEAEALPEKPPQRELELHKLEGLDISGQYQAPQIVAEHLQQPEVMAFKVLLVIVLFLQLGQ
jgi:hypothetical protein